MNIIDAVERAVSELRRGKPVRLKGKTTYAVMALEGLALDELKSLGKPQLLLAPGRIKALGSPGFTGNAGVKSFKADAASIRQVAVLAGLETGKVAKVKWQSAEKDLCAVPLLMRHAELLPAAVIVKGARLPKNAAIITPKQIRHYDDNVAYSLKEVCRAPLNLQCAGDAEIIGFRPASGGREHYAIIVGKGLKAKNPLIRIHSSCYTGDLLSSLACDCRDQLHTALHKMSELGGGIVLYLMQEGRGIGLVNKLRTYTLQSHGLDTVEANHSLGFDDDERPFLPAAEILKNLKVKSVRLLTNNPRKVKELERFGIKVTERVPHIMEEHVHRERYMDVKSAKLGHLLEGRKRG